MSIVKTVAINGVELTLDEAVRTIRPELVSYCRRQFTNLGDFCEPEDLAQEALTKVALNFADFKGKSSFRTWAFTITTRCCLDILRKKRRSPETYEVPDEVESYSTISDTDETLRSVLREDQAEIVRRAIKRVSLIHRQALTYFYLEDLSYQEIADRLQIPLGTVKSRLSNAKLELSRYLPSNLLRN